MVSLRAIYSLFGTSDVFGVEVRKPKNPAAADVKDTAELGGSGSRWLRSMGSRDTSRNTTYAEAKSVHLSPSWDHYTKRQKSYANGLGGSA